MITDYKPSNLAYPIIDIYSDIENELISEICKRLLTYDGISGALEWYTKKLNEVGGLNADAIKIIAKKTGKTEKAILDILKQAGFANIDMTSATKAYKAGLLKIDPSLLLQSPIAKGIIDNSFIELSQAFKLINTRAVQGTNQAYMNVLNKAFIQVAQGVYDYNTAISNGLQEMAEQGIKLVEYTQPNGTIRKYGIEGCVRRDVLTAVFATANKVALESAEDIGTEHVEVSSHLGARIGDGIHPWSDHASWQGKIYKIKGSDEYPNLVEVTGYGDILGLGGVNCRHRMYPFYKGISTPYAEQIDPEENARIYQKIQRQRLLERRIRAYKRRYTVAKEIDAVNQTPESRKEVAHVKMLLDRAYDEITTLVNSEEILKRDYSRERV